MAQTRFVKSDRSARTSFFFQFHSTSGGKLSSILVPICILNLGAAAACAVELFQATWKKTLEDIEIHPTTRSFSSKMLGAPYGHSNTKQMTDALHAILTLLDHRQHKPPNSKNTLCCKEPVTSCMPVT